MQKTMREVQKMTEGNILGALHVYDAIDEKWKTDLEMEWLLLRMADRIAERVLA